MQKCDYRRKNIFFLAIVVLVLFVDQITKNYVIKNIGFGGEKEFFPGIIKFFVVQNTGGAFSFLREFPIVFLVIGIINILIFVYLTFCPTVALNDLAKLGCACVLGGTLGNITDRVLVGAVTDFIDLEFINFAVFNLADVFIDIGVVLILVGWYSQPQKFCNKWVAP